MLTHHTYCWRSLDGPRRRWHTQFRSSHRRCSVRKGVLRNFAKFTRKHLCQSLFLTKLQASACNFIKKEALAQVFSCKFCKISKNTFFIEHLWATASDSCSIPFTFIFKVTDNIIIINILLILLLLIVTDNIMKINSFTNTFQSFCQLFRSTY